MIDLEKLGKKLDEALSSETKEGLEDWILGLRKSVTLVDVFGWSVGDECMTFDSSSWSKTGDIDDNSCYWLKAKIIGFGQSKRNDILADVEFEDGRKSYGHFLNGLMRII